MLMSIRKIHTFNRGLEKGIEKVAIGMLKLNIDVTIIQKATGPFYRKNWLVKKEHI